MSSIKSSPLHSVRIGLTGGVGSGKSTVAQILLKRGVALVDADAIARLVTAPGGAALVPISQQFGAHFLTAEGALDRDQMRVLVFNDPHAKRALEAIIHPLVAQETERQANAALAAGRHTVVFDVPLLVESDRWRQRLDRVLVVDCLVETQIQRVMARSALSQEAVQRIIDTQAKRPARLAAADWVIFNEKLSLDELHAEVLNLPL